MVYDFKTSSMKASEGHRPADSGSSGPPTERGQTQSPDNKKLRTGGAQLQRSAVKLLRTPYMSSDCSPSDIRY